jgi:hypothetical protein
VTLGRTFLDMDALVTEVSDRVLKLPQWAVMLTVLGLLLALLGIAAPIGYNVWSDALVGSAKMESLQRQLDDLKSEAASEKRLRDVERELGELKTRKQGAPNRSAPTLMSLGARRTRGVDSR